MMREEKSPVYVIVVAVPESLRVRVALTPEKKGE